MKHALNKTFKLTRNRKLILLNFALLVLITSLVGLIADSMFAATVACIVSCIGLHILFGWNNHRDFGDKKSVVAANGKTFTTFHKNLVIWTMSLSAIGCWFLGVAFKSPHVSDFLPHIIALFSFQFIVKSILFIMDLPVGTFMTKNGNAHAKLPQPYQSSIIKNSGDIYYSPAYSHMTCNRHHSSRS